MPEVRISRENLPTLAAPLARYSHVSRVAGGELLFFAGQVAVDRDGNLVGRGDIAVQVRQIYANIGDALRGAGASFENVVQFTTYLVGRQNVAPFMAARNEIVDRLYPNGDFPPSTLVLVDNLITEDFLVEVTAIAAA